MNMVPDVKSRLVKINRSTIHDAALDQAHPILSIVYVRFFDASSFSDVVRLCMLDLVK